MQHPNPKQMHDYITPIVERAILAKYIGKLPAQIVSWAGACSAIILVISQLVDLCLKIHSI